MRPQDLIPAPWRRAVKRALGMPVRRLHSDWSILGRIGPVEGGHVVLDVGAHHGWFFHCWRDWCPGAEVHAFEPTPASFARCAELYGAEPNTHLVRAAVGRVAGTGRLHTLGDSAVSNSLLAPDLEAWSAIQYQTGAITSVEVPTLTLDEYAREKGLGEVYLLKIDVQGAELDVLHGAQALLPSVDHVFVESGIRPLYHGGARFSQVAELMLDRGFHLIGFRAWHRGNHALVEADLLFRRNDLLPPIDPTVERIYESS
jgi:FkbM family methyltransferase